MGTSTIAANSIPGSFGWVRFTLDTPAVVATEDWYGVHLTTNLSQFYATYVRFRPSEAAIYSYPYTGDEIYYHDDGEGWHSSRDGIPYRINGTGIDENSLETFDAETEYSFVTWRVYDKFGLRSFTEFTIVVPTLEHPDEDGTNYYLNKDWLLEMRWADTEGVPITDHTLYFAATGDPEFLPRTDRTRYSIVAYKMFLDVTLDYLTTYLWFVRKDLGGGDYVDSEIWSFTTMAYIPPAYSTRTRTPYGGGADITVPSGENNMITVERLIAIARNKFFYEDV